LGKCIFFLGSVYIILHTGASICARANFSIAVAVVTLSPKFRAVVLLLAQVSLAATSAQAALEYNRDIRPILSENCFACHGPDSAARKAKLRLDRFEDAVAARAESTPAIVPGKPDESEAVRRIFAKDEDDVMPPPASHKKLTDAQKDLLKQWIAGGAAYQPHWAYLKIVRPVVPNNSLQSVTEDKASASKLNMEYFVRSRNPIDAFILRNLVSKGIKPSPEAGKYRLLRRLSLDLIGLPPTPEELGAFLKDDSARAYERQVDRLLASPHFGERMAVSWLDLVRFADTVGYHGDQNENTFPYRDYVIDSFNRNKSFSQFTIEQIAGDLLPQPTAEQKTATCFNRLNMVSREGGSQPKEFLAKYTADRVRTVAGAWLGSTIGCAECHDHKYDPISTKDFYSMGAFFADLKQWGVYAEYLPYTPNPELTALDFDHHPYPPEIEVENHYLQGRREKLLRQVDDLLAASAKKLKANKGEKAGFEQWRQAGFGFLKQDPSGWRSPEPKVSFKMKATNEVVKENFTISDGATISFSDKPKENIQITVPVSGWIAAIRLEVVPQTNALSPRGQWTLKGASISLGATLKSDVATNKLSFLYAEADRKEQDFFMGVPIAGVTDRWRTSTNQVLHTAVYLLDKPVQAGTNDSLVLGLGTGALTSVRVSISPFAALEPLNAGLINPGFKKELGKARPSKSVSTVYLLSTGWDTNAFAQVKKLKREAWECHDGRSRVMIAKSVEPLTIRVLPRGNWQDESGEIVQPATLHFLPQPANPGNRRLNRLDLARWLVSPENPLTARAFMNRAWKQFFGTGISAVVDDLGAQGEWPVHPELLDWLAAEFMESGWDVKHMVKLLVMSATYRQDSNDRRELKELDPNNRWVSHQSPRRLEAEFVRDNALRISGLLNADIGGPSSHPYQPEGYYANIQFPSRDWHADRDERQYRRGLYTHWQRAFLHPMLANFDAPAREECTANRTVSNTPQQGLTLLNDPEFVEAARVFAGRLLQAPKKSDEQRIALAYEMALARPARDKEKEGLMKFLCAQREHYQAHVDEAEKLLRVGIAPTPEGIDKGELAAWANLCRVVLNLHETITRY
jgi:hypothetical protein